MSEDISHPWLKGGGPAFPTKISEGHHFKGMTLRDYFAGQALAGDMAAQSEHCGVIQENVTDSNLDLLARHYYRISDAMLREREKDPRP